MKIHPVGAEFLAAGRTDGRTVKRDGPTVKRTDTDRQTDRHEVSSGFSKFCDRA
jgi:hypothetical protein